MRHLLFWLLLISLTTFSYAQKTYRGAEVYSNDAVTYGKFVMNMKMIKGSGMLSTFFTYKGDSYIDGVFWEEIDIEVLGKDNAEIMSTNIITDGVGGLETHSTEEIHFESSLADAYHTYTLIWTPDSIAWYIDDVRYRLDTSEVTDVLTSPEGYRFNAWISCEPGWVGEIDRAALPQYQYVDWIEYHSYDAGSFSFEWRDDFTTFDNTRWSKADWSFDCNEVQFTPNNAYIEAEQLVLAITDPNPPSTSTESVGSKNTIKVVKDAHTKQINLVFATESQSHYQLIDITGKVVRSGSANSLETSFSYEGLNSGIYFIRVHTASISEVKQVYIK